MPASWILAPAPTGWPLHGLALLRKSIPFLRPPGAPDPALAEIERLADTSPHLLADLGFHEIAATGDPALRIWTRGDLVVLFRPQDARRPVRAMHAGDLDLDLPETR